MVAANRRARVHQIRDEPQTFAQGKVDAAPVETQGGKSEKLNIQTSHHERLIPQARVGDGSGTRAS
jgi:hypothetical protein